MNVDTVVRYWLETAEEDWPVAEHLYLEKLLKALVVQSTGEHAPRSHNLMLLAERAGLTVSEHRRDILVRVTGYNIEARYPEEHPSARRRYTQAYTETELHIIQRMGAWLKSELKHQST